LVVAIRDVRRSDGALVNGNVASEFVEETGHDPHGDFFPLGEARQPGGKVVQAWAIEGDWESSAHSQQYLRDGVAAALWTPTDLSLDRPRGLVWYRRRVMEDPEGTNGFRRLIG
jgi:hypothetical protein